MTPTARAGEQESVEALCAALRESYERIGRLADDVVALVRRDDPASADLANLADLTRATVPLWRAVASRLERAAMTGLTPAEGEALAQTRRVLAESAARVRAATEEAGLSLQRLGGQLDEGIRRRKGIRAYRMHH